MRNLNRVMDRTDWPLLAEQKQALNEVCKSGPHADTLGGLLNWVDAIQDAAQIDGFPVVFLAGDNE